MGEDTLALTLVDLGAGKSTRTQQEFPDAKVIKVDLDPEVKPDIICDLRKLELEDNSVDGAVSRHTLEHIPWPETETTLAEWARVIRPGGLLHISVPDLGWLAQEILQGRMTVGIIAGIFGGQWSEYQEHRAGFTVPSLASQVEAAGLEILSVERKPFAVLTIRHPTTQMREELQEIELIARKPDEETGTGV